jgi:hypothetical protein
MNTIGSPFPAITFHLGGDILFSKMGIASKELFDVDLLWVKSRRNETHLFKEGENMDEGR